MWPRVRSPRETLDETVSFMKIEWVLIVFFVLSYVVSCWLANYALYRYVTTPAEQRIPLRDLGFDIIDENASPAVKHVADAIPIISLVVSLISIKFCGSNQLLADMISRGTLIFLLNNISQILTVVPHASSANCYEYRIRPDGNTNYHDHIGLWMLYEPNILKNCSDMMWSGHTAHTLQAFHALYAIYGASYRHTLFACLVVIYSILVTCMIAIRYHYAMDIFVATVIVCFVFADVRPGKYRRGTTEKTDAARLGLAKKVVVRI
jgi:hypothetical protein